MTPSEAVPTVLLATADADADAVTFWLATDLETVSTPGQRDADGTWSAQLVGAAPDSTVTVTVVADGEEVSETVQTGSLPAGFPAMPVVTGEPLPGFLLTIARDEDQKVAVALDGLGRPVWWHPIDAYGADVQAARLRLSADRKHFVFNTIALANATAQADAERGITTVSLEGTVERFVSLPEHHHDFWLHEDGSLAYLAYAEDERGKEIDTLRYWQDDDTGLLYASDELLEDPTDIAFLNTVEFIEASDSYWLSANQLDTLVQVDASTGERVATLGGPESDWVLDDPFENQHGFDLVGDTLVLFDNGNASDGDSRAVRYHLDPESGVASAEWHHHAAPPLYSTFLGDALFLPNDRTLVNWTTQGLLHAVDASGDVKTEWTLEDYTYLTYLTHTERLLPE